MKGTGALNQNWRTTVDNKIIRLNKISGFLCTIAFKITSEETRTKQQECFEDKASCLKVSFLLITQELLALGVISVHIGPTVSLITATAAESEAEWLTKGNTEKVLPTICIQHALMDAWSIKNLLLDEKAATTCSMAAWRPSTILWSASRNPGSIEFTCCCIHP